MISSHEKFSFSRLVLVLMIGFVLVAPNVSWGQARSSVASLSSSCLNKDGSVKKTKDLLKDAEKELKDSLKKNCENKANNSSDEEICGKKPRNVLCPDGVSARVAYTSCERPSPPYKNDPKAKCNLAKGSSNCEAADAAYKRAKSKTDKSGFNSREEAEQAWQTAETEEQKNNPRYRAADSAADQAEADLAARKARIEQFQDGLANQRGFFDRARASGDKNSQRNLAVSIGNINDQISDAINGYKDSTGKRLASLGKLESDATRKRTSAEAKKRSTTKKRQKAAKDAIQAFEERDRAYAALSAGPNVVCNFTDNCKVLKGKWKREEYQCPGGAVKKPEEPEGKLKQPERIIGRKLEFKKETLETGRIFRLADRQYSLPTGASYSIYDPRVTIEQSPNALPQLAPLKLPDAFLPTPTQPSTAGVPTGPVTETQPTVGQSQILFTPPFTPQIRPLAPTIGPTVPSIGVPRIGGGGLLR